MGYWAYYLAIFIAYWAIDHPVVLLGLVLFFVLRRYIPDPWIFLRTMGHIGRLKEQIRANPANVTARRDLARIYLQRMRPGAALALIEEARERDQHSAELLLLSGTALYRTGRYEQALGPLVEAVERDPRVGFGQAYLVAGDALSKLGRHAEAIDAYDRFCEKNTSSVEGFTKLAMAHNRADEAEQASAALAEARATFSQIPSYKRRAELGWYVRAQLLRLFI